MVQELQVLKCYSCSTFQVHIVKKAKNWECKLCHEKQSLREVFGRGSGKDCRVHVQKLNALRATREGNNLTDDQFSVFLAAAPTSCVPENIQPDSVSTQPTPSNVSNKWDKYLDNNEGEESPEEDNRHLLENARNQKKKRRKVCNDELDLSRKRKRSKANNWSAPTQQDEDESNDQSHASVSNNNTHCNQYSLNNRDNDHIECLSESQLTLTTQVKFPQSDSSKAHQNSSTSKPTTHFKNYLKQSATATSKWSKYLTNEDDNELFETEEKHNEESRDNVEIHNNSNIYNNSPCETNDNITQLSPTDSTFNKTNRNLHEKPDFLQNILNIRNEHHSTSKMENSESGLDKTNRKSDERLEFLQDILNIKHHSTSKMENSDSGLEETSMVNQQPKEKNINSQCSLFEETDDALLDQLLGDF
uniref:UPF0544 protein C5orf45 homolog n=1 Tax=Cacopsylla melanoneura TaxID=428564 RepID=A0A8D9EN83_9HEMI